MGKKKKKSQKKKKSNLPESSGFQGMSLLDTLSAAKKNETTLQTLLKGVSEQGFVHPKKEEEEKITPQLSHESKTKIAAEYLKEDVLLAERERKKKKSRTKLVPQTQKEPKPVKTVKSPVSSKQTKKAQPEKESRELIKPVVPPTAKRSSKESTPSEVSTPPINQTVEEKITPPSISVEEPSVIKKENIYIKLTEFFEGLLGSYNDRYDRWENSISAILAILRKMRKITKKNTEDLTVSINNIFEKIKVDLAQFKIKRTEIEKVAEVDIQSMSGKFKRVLGLLELQVKEYQLKRETDNYIREIRYFIR